eukprot:TRINITY_DN7255_c0_g1_i1.p1 TRINITY_DN7255_c0_g1~~TRINITY_DN7255_c0_g1_i1.p1  ORF type:complete len:138 (-),score=9.91 TRINITY_DN7255_c0_g1_i1:206-619(-)
MATASKMTTRLLRDGALARTLTGSMRLRSGMGLPVGNSPPPDKPLHIQHELIWNDGSAFPEPVLDRIAAPVVGKYEALAWCLGGLGFFGFVALLAVWNDKPSKVPWTPKEFPFDNLRVELGGDPNVSSTSGLSNESG